jgi:hypothetical protein
MHEYVGVLTVPLDEVVRPLKVLCDVVLRIVVCLHYLVEVDELLGVREIRLNRGGEYCTDLELLQHIYVVSCNEASQVESSIVVD